MKPRVNIVLVCCAVFFGAALYVAVAAWLQLPGWQLLHELDYVREVNTYGNRRYTGNATTVRWGLAAVLLLFGLAVPFFAHALRDNGRSSKRGKRDNS